MKEKEKKEEERKIMDCQIGRNFSEKKRITQRKKFKKEMRSYLQETWTKRR